jgi:hypothetical protein
MGPDSLLLSSSPIHNDAICKSRLTINYILYLLCLRRTKLNEVNVLATFALIQNIAFPNEKKMNLYETHLGCTCLEQQQNFVSNRNGLA